MIFGLQYAGERANKGGSFIILGHAREEPAAIARQGMGAHGIPIQRLIASKLEDKI